MHEVNLRLIEEEMVVQRRDREAGIERGAHRRAHFVLEQREVAHQHRARVVRGKCNPRREPHERRQLPAVHGHRHVDARQGQLQHALGFAVSAFDARDALDTCGVEWRVERMARGARAEQESRAELLHEPRCPSARGNGAST
jgi:hypothetical protein